jgi:Ca-activated chloride channel family protein
MRALPLPLLVVTLAAVTFAQQPVFRSDTRVVPILATVQDADGRLVPNLEREMFTILDNGRPQEITVFENTSQPFTTVVMLDFSGSMTANLKLLKQGTEQFLIRMLPEDKGQVGAFSDKIMFSGRFTNDRDALIDALDDLQYGNPTALYDAVNASIDKLVDLGGRRVVVVFTDGDDNFSKVKFDFVRDRARDNDIMVYAIGLRSLVQGQVTRPDARLPKLAETTGGGYFELKHTDDLGPTFTRVAQELHSLYLLGFSPEKLDGREHRVEIKLKDPGLKVRARTSYVAERENAAPTSKNAPTSK